MTATALRFCVLAGGLLVAAGCTAPGDYIDKWFGTGPAQKPAELVVFKPTATARILWQGNVGPAERNVFTPAINDGAVYAAGTAGQIVRFDAVSGKVVASLKICDGTDATFFDPGTKNVFVSCSDGHITVAHEDGPAKLSLVETITTARGARTMTLDPVTHRLYTAAQDFAASAPNPAPAPGRRGGPPPVPDSFHVLVYAPR